MFEIESNPQFAVILPESRATQTRQHKIVQPLLTQTKSRILVLGSMPDENETEPFTGGGCHMMFNALNRRGIAKAGCALAYVSPVFNAETFGKKFNPATSHIIREQLEELKQFVSEFKPDIVLLLGDLALWAAFPSRIIDGAYMKTNSWRGSLMMCDDIASILYGCKVLPTYTPREVCISWDKSPLFFMDLERFAEHSTKPFEPIPYDFELYVSPERAIYLLSEITDSPNKVALDIEGGVYGMSCVSFATSATKAFIVPFAQYSLADKARVLKVLQRFLTSSTPKILQNQLYDNFVLSYTYKSHIRNVVWDTMLSGWEIYPELPKSLAVQTSVWTLQPYYKMDRKSTDTTTLHKYCCLDSCVTWEIAHRHEQFLLSKPRAFTHFKLNMAMLNPLLYMELRGIRYNVEAAATALAETCAELTSIQTLIDNAVTDCWKRYGSRGPAPRSLNVNSPVQVAECLYIRFGYPKQHPKKGREVDTSKVTTDADALLELLQKFNGPNDEIIRLLLKYRSLDKTRVALEIKTDDDGRVRCGYNVVGTETGRLACKGSPTGSGANLTTITKKLRHLYLADEDHWLFQCDLSGADGWTVAAHCSLRGDPTMMDDYMFGLKPAKIIVLMLRLGSARVASMFRDELKKYCKTVDENPAIDPQGWQYFAAKQVQHGTNYKLGVSKMADNILKKGYKEKGQLYIVSPQECQLLQDAYLQRYPGIKFWHAAIQAQIIQHGELDSASGHVRKFFGRRQDHATLREACAHEPQINTTFATNMAMLNLWQDKANRRGNKFIVQPVHHVHDALIGQFHKADTETAVPLIRKWFQNKLVIAHHDIVIPFEGAYGPSWGELGPDYGGGLI